MASPPPHGKSSFPSPLEPDLDYNEEEEDEEKEVEKRRSSSHAHSRLLSEDGELASDEDGEIKEATPPFGNSSSRCKVERRSDESLQAGAKQAHNSNICRHFLQGRCSWGNDCRFIHELPEGEEMRRGRSDRDGSPHLSLHPPTIYAISHEPIPIDRIHALYDRVMPSSVYSHMAWAPPPSRVKGGVRGPRCPGSREKVEESVGWHRLRTITKGWESEEEEEEEERRRRRRKGGTDDLRTKLKQKRRYTPSSDDSEKDDTDLNLKKQKRFKKETKQVFERGDDWFDPWSRKKIKRREENQNSSSSSEEESSRKSLKRK